MADRSKHLPSDLRKVFEKHKPGRLMSWEDRLLPILACLSNPVQTATTEATTCAAIEPFHCPPEETDQNGRCHNHSCFMHRLLLMRHSINEKNSEAKMACPEQNENDHWGTQVGFIPWEEKLRGKFGKKRFRHEKFEVIRALENVPDMKFFNFNGASLDEGSGPDLSHLVPLQIWFDALRRRQPCQWDGDCGMLGGANFLMHNSKS